MDLVDLIAEKYFLGQEFLTWLWFKSEQSGGVIDMPERGNVVVVFEKHMQLEFGEGEAHEKLVSRGLQTELHEARAGLTMGKKVEQARIQLVVGEYEYHLTICGSMFDFSGIKLPKAMAASGEQEEVEGMLLDRIGLHEQAVKVIDDLFGMFLEVRTDPEAWGDEVGLIRGWIHREAA